MVPTSLISPVACTLLVLLLSDGDVYAGEWYGDWSPGSTYGDGHVPDCGTAGHYGASDESC